VGIFNKIKYNNAVIRIDEEKYYELVASELENGMRKKGLWLKALSKSNGDENKANSLYVSFRVQAIKDEFEIDEISNKKELEKVEDTKKSVAVKKHQTNEDAISIKNREARIRNVLQDKLKREPTGKEICAAKWSGMCLK